MDKSFNLIELIRTLINWKWPIIIITALAGIVAIIVSLFVMPEYYKSTSVFYPTNQGITDRSALFRTDGGGEARVDYFGTKHDANRVLTIANSAPLIDFMINHFKLWDHYDIDTAKNEYWRTKVRREFTGNYSAIKTERDAIEITMFDTDPNVAAKMVNLLVEKIDEHNKRPVINNKTRIKTLFAEKVIEKRAEVDDLTDSLSALIKRGNLKVISNSDGSVYVTGNDQQAVEEFKVIQQRHQNALDDLNEISTLNEQYDVSSKENVPSIYVLEVAYPADRKSKPIRSLVVLSTIIITFFVSIIGVLLIEQIQYIRKALNNAA